MNSKMILSYCLKSCYQKFNIQTSFKLKNVLISLHNQTNVFRFCFTNHCTQINEQCYKFHDINRELISQIIPSIKFDEKLETISSEIEFVIARNRRFPDKMTADQLESLCKLESRTQRLEYLTFLFKKEKYKILDAAKRLKKMKERTSRKPDLGLVKDNSLEYGLGRNSMLLSVRNHAMNKFYRSRLANAILFGEKIVLDLSYDPFMTEKEKSACVSQLALIYSANRKNRYPYDLHFCNALSSYMSVQKLQKVFLPDSSESLITLTEKSYLDIFPKEKLVYLSPHATETMQEYDHNAVYVIGAFVDTVKKQKISVNKAENEEIKSYSLPLDDYVLWGAGTKSLTVNQVFEIMLIMKNTGDWKKAFEVIPTRKIRKLEKEQVEKNEFPDKIFLVNTC